MHTLRRIWLLVLLVAVVAIIWIFIRQRVGSNDNRRSTDSSNLATHATTAPPSKSAAEECPHYWGASQGGPFQTDTLSASGRWTNVPEYNDCQKLIVHQAANDSYAHIGALFLRFAVKGVFAAAPRIERPTTTGTVTVVTPLTFAGMPLAENGHLEVVGQVYSEGPYLPLGIQTGHSCVVLYWQTPVTQASVMKAWMVSVADQAECGKHVLSISATGSPFPLEVTSKGGSPPPVARWDWDGTANEQFIGIICPTGWCELHHQPAYSTSATYQKMGKGWYDEQYLASPNPGPGGTITVASPRVRGTIFPVAGLQARTMAAYPAGKWMPVAHVALNPASSDYKSKYNLDAASPDGALAVMTQISLCFEPTGTQSHCPGANALSGVTISGKCAPDTKNNGTWYSEFRSPVTQTAKVFCVMYRPTPDNSQPPGVVSWRWTLKDETVWISCPLGCCEGNSIGT